MQLYPRGELSEPTFNWIFEYQPIASETQPSHYKTAESNLLGSERSSPLGPGSCLGYISILIHLVL